MINSSDILQLCRLCLVEDKVNHPIFEESDDLRSISLKISSCLPVSIHKDDSLPKKICDTCSTKLDSFYQFWSESANAEKQLLQWVDKNKTSKQQADQSRKMETTEVKKELEDTVDPIDMTSEAQTYILQQQQLPYTSSAPNDSLNTSESEEPAAKRPRRASAVKALQHMGSEDEDDAELAADNYAKTESDDSDKEEEDEDSNYQENPSTTSVEDQPGPSGMSKKKMVLDDTPYELYDDPDSNYKCEVCNGLFETKAAFFSHHMSPCGKKFMCCKCTDSFKTLSSLYEHSEKYHVQQEEEEEIVLDYNGQLVKIPNQNIVESNELLYVLDDTQCVNEIVIEQQQCEQERTDLSETVRIVRMEHGYMLQDDEPSGTFRTQQRARKVAAPKPRTNVLKRRHELPDFTSTNYLYIQPNEEIDIPHYKCLRCEQLFINKFAFFRHIEKGKCYINNCDVCTETFSKNSEFYMHYVVEHTDRAICNFCFRTFMYEKNVKEHMLRHLDQFRHRCEECNKGFYTVREYRNHYRNRHMGIRHKCEFCSRTFADEYYFKRHLATHNMKVEFNVDSQE
ncbi:zinc finger protein ZFMSA12A-like isoform X7 [Coccinella septempunctata]|uniref:zinc finger protein ZFMSA12A-like isoform X7 n=1 Tax=Coccinella septempunctata TaxID=41139 RepID=UPI001D06D785|nr:zinc finger protein ZFMSA12A-like isoform X7 [Coccinella septempunctata]